MFLLEDCALEQQHLYPIMAVLRMPSYLARINTAVNPGANHVGRDVVAVDFWLPAVIVGNQSHSSLLQSGVPLCLCQRKHK